MKDTVFKFIVLKLMINISKIQKMVLGCLKKNLIFYQMYLLERIVLYNVMDSSLQIIKNRFVQAFKLLLKYCVTLIDDDDVPPP